jgi:hypothetical protein
MMAADLVVTGFTADGEDLVVTYDVTTDTAAEFDIGVYRSSDGVTPDSLLFSQRVTASNLLAVGTGHEISLVADFTDVPEDYQLMVVLDSADEVSETSETNNILLFAGGVFQTVDGTVKVHGTSSADQVEIEGGTDLTVWVGSESSVFDLASVTGIGVPLACGK